MITVAFYESSLTSTTSAFAMFLAQLSKLGYFTSFIYTAHCILQFG